MGPHEAAFTGQLYSLEDSNDRRTGVPTVHNGEWASYGVLSGILHAIRFTEDPERQLLLLARAHGLYRISKKGISFEDIGKDDEGFLMDLRRIGARWYAVGGHHHVYREEATGWQRFDQGVHIPDEPGEARILLSIDGVAEDDIYAVGFNGVILHHDGSAWAELESPTNVGLQRVLCVSRDEVYICGYGNALYRGNRTGWQALTAPDENVVYWDMARFHGRIYVCTKQRLFVLNGDRLDEVDIPVEGPLGFYRLDASDTELWSCGNECVLRFDGTTWTQYVWPDNA
ncbi:hypothetical protein [Falsiroseomonas sp.]|uniref:hypothetical protein n=1 Tax=Falsiroseomonas sp. TaxID=2870721 RepID=UPI0035653570